MEQKAIDFISEIDENFKSNPIQMTDDESIDLYYINRLFQYEPGFRIYILTALGLFMDKCSSGKGITIDLTKNEARIKLTTEIMQKIESDAIRSRVLNHAENLAKVVAERAKA